MSSAEEYIDFVKFGWGTAVVSSDLRAKIKVLTTKDIGFYFGATLFEKFVLQNRFDDFRRFCQQHSCQHVEVSNGTIPSTTLQTYFITRLGPDVNLGNVPVHAAIGLETLRLGLRADTLTAFE
jgi:phosphosulfolactate synthase